MTDKPEDDFQRGCDGDIMVAKGCRTENYERNPLWFFGHQSLPLPIKFAVFITEEDLTGAGIEIEPRVDAPLIVGE